MSATPDSTLANPEQLIADLQRQLDACRAELAEARAQQTATAEVFQVINSSPGDLAPVFEALLDKALALCGANFGFIRTYDGESFHLGAMRGVPFEHTELLKQPRHPPFTGTALERLVAGESVVEIADIADQPGYTPFAQVLVAAGVVRTMVWVALRKERTLLGFISVFRSEIQPFTDKQIALLQNFAAQAVIAMENARLLTETREALEQQTATAEVLQVINTSPGDLAPVFDAMLEKTIGLCDAKFGQLVTSTDGEVFTVAAAHGPPGIVEFLRNRPPTRPGPGTSIERLVRGERCVHIYDAMAEEAYRRGDPTRRALVDLGGCRTAVSVGLRKDDTLLGMISAYRQEVRPFSDKQIALLENFAAQAVIAIENARLINETREALEQQTATAEVLQVINSSPGDLAPVFDVILQKAHALCGTSHGALFLSDGERFMPAAMSDPELIAAPLRQGGMGSDAPLLRPLLAGEPFAHIIDLTLVDHPLARAAVATGVRTLLSVPLRKGGTLIGMINAARLEVHPFSEKQIALLQNFAAQAVIAIENARLLTETREALEQQTATAEVLQVINSSPGDLAPVFEEILDKAHTLCGAAYGGLLTYDGDAFRVAAARGDTRFVEYWRQGPIRPPEGTPLWRVMRGEGLIQIIDAQAEDSYHNAPPYARLIDLGGVRTFLSLPLRTDDALLGVITAYRLEVRPFTDKQIALLQNFAAQAVIAMENARLLTETREALEQQTATAEVLQVINASPGDLAPVFDAMLEKAMRLCEAAFGILITYDGQQFHHAAVKGVPDAFAEHRRRNPSMTFPSRSNVGRHLQGENVVHIPDLEAEDTTRAVDQGRALLDLGGARTLLSAALRKDGALLGVLSIYRQEVRPFSDKQIALLQNFAAQAVIAMENARLLTETREALEQQTATAEVLQVINSSPGDLAPVFDVMLEKATTLCEAAFGILRTWDGERFNFGAAYGDLRFTDWARRESPPTPQQSDASPLGQIVRGEPLVVMADAASEPAYQTSPGFREMVEVSGIRSGIVVALTKERALLGMMTVYRKEVRPFTEKQVTLLQNFAAQAVIAMENARLIGELRERTDQVAELNRGLEARVAEQVEELGRVGRLKQFLAPQLAELIVSQGNENILESHRREIVVVFCDLRGYTAFTETAEPEEVLDFLREYHGALGPLVAQFQGTLDQFSGDGIMVFFNDPVPCPDPAERAVKMAVAMREAAGALTARWRRRGRELGFGAGIAQGYATLGQIGFAERSGYTAIGTVCNLAARLCAEAKDGQILIAQRVALAVEETTVLEEIGALSLKGLTQPVVAFNVPAPGGAAISAPHRSDPTAPSGTTVV